MLVSIALIGLGLVAAPHPGTRSRLDGLLGARSTEVRAERVVFLGSGLSEEDLITFTAAVAASRHPGVVLLDSVSLSPYLQDFLKSFRPEGVVPVGSFPAGRADLERRLGVPVAAPVAWTGDSSAALWQTLFPRAERVVLCPGTPRRLLLQAACLAGILQAPLVVIHDPDGEPHELHRRLKEWHTQEVYAAGVPAKIRRQLPGVTVHSLKDAEAVAACYLRHQLAQGPIQTLVVANPADVTNDLGRMSSLAPWLALQRRAALLFTNEAGDNTHDVVEAALHNRALRQADALILVASLQAIPPERRPNPVPGKDLFIEMEPFTPTGSEPFSFATGRLFSSDRSVVCLMLARQRLVPEKRASVKALIVSNPSGGLPLLETFSRTTAKEFGNCGYQTSTLFGHECSREAVRRLLPAQDIFLWEGHHSTMVKDYEMPQWTEPLQPALVFLQSCLALTPPEAQPFLHRGAIAVVGSSTRTYSASGGACAQAFFDALLYENQSLGSSLRHAKNYLLACSLLKEKLLGDSAQLRGASLRAAWAFTLWGDPTVHLPQPTVPPDALPCVRHEVRGNTLVLSLPEQTYDRVVTSKYQAQIRPNARLAGLLHKDSPEDDRRLVPLVFAEVHLPKAPRDKAPRLRSRLPESRYVFSWDARRRCGYLLVLPRARDQKVLRFHIDWESEESVVRGQRSAIGP